MVDSIDRLLGVGRDAGLIETVIHDLFYLMRIFVVASIAGAGFLAGMMCYLYLLDF